MSYDEYAILSAVTIPLVLLFYKYVLLKSYRFMKQFKIVRVTLLEEYQKQIRDLSYMNDLLKKGTKIAQDENGQFSFELPEETEEQYKRFRIFTDNGEWEQVWAMADWISFSLNKKYVRRGRKVLWVDEILPNDREVELPCETYLIKDYLPKKRRTRRALKKVAVL